jgi:hypothetical protein
MFSSVCFPLDVIDRAVLLPADFSFASPFTFSLLSLIASVEAPEGREADELATDADDDGAAAP